MRTLFDLVRSNAQGSSREKREAGGHVPERREERVWVRRVLCAEASASQQAGASLDQGEDRGRVRDLSRKFSSGGGWWKISFG